MKTFLRCFIVLVVVQIAAGNQNPYGHPNNPASYPVQHNPDGSLLPNDQDRRVPQQQSPLPYHGQQSPTQRSSEYDQQQQQYQQLMQQQQQHRTMAGGYPPTGYISGRNIQQEPQGPGLFSKLKNSLFAAGNAISDSLALSSLDGTPVNTPQQGQGFYNYPPNAANRGQPYPAQRTYPEPTTSTYDTSNTNTMSMNRDPRMSPRSQVPPQAGLMGRFKSIFGLDDASLSDTSGNGAYRAVFPNVPVTNSAGGSGSRPLPPHLVQQQVQQNSPYPTYPGYTTSSNNGNSGDSVYQANTDYYTTPSADSVSSSILDSTPTTTTTTPYSTLPATPHTYGNVGPSSTSTTTTTTSSTSSSTTATILQTPPEPQVFVHEGSVVMILKPREFARKKALFTAAGSDALQVFSDFEHVLTSFNVQNERTLTSAELLELSGAVNERALHQLSALAEDFEATSDNVEHSAFEQLSARCQSVLCKEGQVRINSVGQVTRALSPRLGLRQGWSEALHLLASTGVPAYLFSSGYGDVVTAALLQGLYPAASSSNSGPAQQPLPLPQNLRVISNFFRSAPDGTVRAFSQPIVHERNKNATTAAAHMGMEVLSRPHAIVLGAHEDDVNMTQGVEGLQEQISIGYLELTEDLNLRLPVYLSTFDVVIVGDGNFEYIRSLLEDLLQLPRKSGSSSGSTSPLGSGLSSGLGSVSSAGQGLALGLRNRIGALLNGNPQPQSTSQPQPQQPQYQYQHPPQHQQQYAPPQQNAQGVQGGAVQGSAGQGGVQSGMQGQYTPAGYNAAPSQQGQYNINNNNAQRPAHYPPSSPQHPQAQQHNNQHYNAAPAVGNGASNGVNGSSGSNGSGSSEQGKSPSYLDFNEYQ